MYNYVNLWHYLMKYFILTIPLCLDRISEDNGKKMSFTFLMLINILAVFHACLHAMLNITVKVYVKTDTSINQLSIYICNIMSICLLNDNFVQCNIWYMKLYSIGILYIIFYYIILYIYPFHIISKIIRKDLISINNVLVFEIIVIFFQYY